MIINNTYCFFQNQRSYDIPATSGYGRKLKKVAYLLYTQGPSSVLLRSGMPQQPDFARKPESGSEKIQKKYPVIPGKCYIPDFPRFPSLVLLSISPCFRVFMSTSLPASGSGKFTLHTMKPAHRYKPGSGRQRHRRCGLPKANTSRFCRRAGGRLLFHGCKAGPRYRP